MKSLTLQEIYFKLQQSTIALLPHLYTEAVQNIQVNQQYILEEDAQLGEHCIFKNEIRFETLSYEKLLSVFIKHKTLSKHLAAYFASQENEKTTLEFLYLKTKLLLQYQEKFSAQNLKSMLQENYTYNSINAIHELLSFINFFNTSKDERFIKEIAHMNRFVVENVYAPKQELVPATNTTTQAPNIAYQAKRKQAIEKIGANKTKPKKKHRLLRFFILLVFIVLAFYVVLQYSPWGNAIKEKIQRLPLPSSVMQYFEFTPVPTELKMQPAEHTLPPFQVP